MFQRKQSIFIIGAVIIALVLLCAFFFTPGADTPDIQLADPAPGTGNGDDLTAESPAAPVVEITTENVQAVIATLTRIESYSREIRQTRYWDGGQSYGSRMATILVTPEIMRLRWDNNENMVITADTYHLWFGGGAVITRPVTAGLGESLDKILDQFQGIPSYETVLELDPAQIIAAGYTERNIGGELRTVIYVAVETGTLGYTDFFYICLSTGLLVEMETFDGEIPIYRLETLHLSLKIPLPEDFHLSDGSDPLAG